MKARTVTIAGLTAALAISAVPIAQASRGERPVAKASGDDRATAARKFEGRIASIDRGTRSFRIRRESGARMRLKVISSTRFERIAGFSGLRRGLAVEVAARPTNAGWVVDKVERRGAHGADDRSRDDGGKSGDRYGS